MPAQFDWRSEDDREWQEYPAPEGQPGRTGRAARRRFFLAVAAVLIVVAAALLAYRGLRRYVVNATGSVEEDIQATHDLVELAAEQSDAEVLASHLSSRDPAWTETQLSLAQEGLLYNRLPFGLSWQPQFAPTGMTVDVAADLTQAELTAVYSFLSDVDEGGQEPITLQRSEIYRLSQDRWLLSPPFDEYWGPRRTFNGRYISLTYSERDQAFSQRLAADLEELLATACHTLTGLSCPPGVGMNVTLSENPADLLKLSASGSILESAASLSLPSPTLVGMPVDEASYRALFHGYGRWIVASLVGRLVGWQCCEHVLFYQALLDAQLRQLGLKPWPIKGGQNRQLDEQSLFVGSLNALWQRSVPAEEIAADANGLLVYAFIEFLVGQGGEPPIADMQRALVRATTFEEWLGRVAEDASGAAAIESSWLDYVRQQTEASPGSQLVAWPDQDLLLFCDQNVDVGASLHRYNPRAGMWADETTAGRAVRMIDLPGNFGVLITETEPDSGQTRTVVWASGRTYEVEQNGGILYATGHSSPDLHYTSLMRYGSVDGTPRYYLLDLAGCRQGQCALRAIDGDPEWSPDGLRTIVAEPRGADTLVLGNALGQPEREIGIGKDPFWLDDRTYVYLRKRPIPVVVMGSVEQAGVETLIQAADLAAALGADGGAGLVITHITVQPRPPRTLFLTATDPGGLHDYLFVYDRTSDELSLLETHDDTLYGLEPQDFSPDGRWLALAGPPTSRPNGRWIQQTYLFDTAKAKTWILPDAYVSPFEFFRFSDWSVDSQWYAQLGESDLQLVAPAMEYSQHVNHRFEDCQSVAWVPAGEEPMSARPSGARLVTLQADDRSCALSATGRSIGSC